MDSTVDDVKDIDYFNQIRRSIRIEGLFRNRDFYFEIKLIRFSKIELTYLWRFRSLIIISIRIYNLAEDKIIQKIKFI